MNSASNIEKFRIRENSFFMINSCLVVVVKCSVEEGGLGGGEGLGKIQVSSTRDIMRDDSA